MKFGPHIAITAAILAFVFLALLVGYGCRERDACIESIEIRDEPLQKMQQLEAMPPKSVSDTSASPLGQSPRTETTALADKCVQNVSTACKKNAPLFLTVSPRGETAISSELPATQSGRNALSPDEWWTGMLDYILMRESSGGPAAPENPYQLTDICGLDMVRLGIREPVLNDDADCRRAIREWLSWYINSWDVRHDSPADWPDVYRLYRAPGDYRKGMAR